MALVLGFLIGLPFVMPVGPVALTLFGVGAEQGRRAALVGATGVVLGDAVLLPIALGGAGTVGALDPGVLQTIELVLGAVLGVVGVLAWRRAESARSALESIRRPARTLFAITIVNPLGAAAWLGLALALPASVHGAGDLAAFGLGLLVASAVWHAFLAMAGGTLSNRLGEVGRTRLAQCSAIGMVAIACLLMMP